MGTTIFSKISIGQLLGLGLAVAYCVVIEVWLGWQSVLAPLTELPALLLVQMVALLGLTYIVRALRLYNYFRGELQRRFGLTLAIMLTHNLFNHLLPARLGEASLPLLLHRHLRVDVLKGASALFWFRLLDVHALLSFVLLALAFAPSNGPLFDAVLVRDEVLNWPVVLLIAAFLAAPLGIFLCMRRFTGWSGQPRQRWQHLLWRLSRGLPERSSDFWLSWIWTALTWLIKLSTLAWLLASLLSISWSAAIFGVSGGELTAVLPVHAPGGFGTYAGGIVAALTPLDIDLDATLIAAANTHLVLFAAALVSGLGGWLSLQQDSKN